MILVRDGYGSKFNLITNFGKLAPENSFLIIRLKL